MTVLRYSPFFVALLALHAGVAHSASLSDLYASVPAPPADVAVAMSWVRDGKVVAPQVLSLRAAIEAERAAIVVLNGGPLPAEPAAPPSVSGESPEVQSALAAYRQYLGANSGKEQPAAVVGKRARWLHAAMRDRFRSVVGSMKPCALPCADAAAMTQNEPSVAPRRALMTQDFQQWNTLFADWRAKRAPLVSSAQAQIAATGDGAKASSAAARSGIAQYRAAMLREVEAALSITELALKRFVATESGDVDVVSASTYSPKPKS